MERDDEGSPDENGSLLPSPAMRRKSKHAMKPNVVTINLDGMGWNEEESSGTEVRVRRHQEAAAAAAAVARKQRATHKRTLSVSEEKNLTSSKLAHAGMMMTRLRGGKKRQQRRLGGTDFDVVSDGDVDDMPPPSNIWACCFAEQFDHEEMREHCLASPLINSVKAVNDEVLVIRAKPWPSNAAAYLFTNYGTGVFWGLSEDEMDAILVVLRDVIEDVHLLEEEEESRDDFLWYYSSNEAFSIVHNILALPAPLNPVVDNFIRLAVSYALSTSVKLDTFEDAIEKTINATQHIPQELATKGKMSLSKQNISRYIGELYIQKSSVNLVHDILDAPDFFWDLDDEYQRIYSKCRRMLNIDQRCEVLNKRLDVLGELLDILRTSQAEQHSNRLELIVIWLIVVEIVLGLFEVFVGIFGKEKIHG